MLDIVRALLGIGIQILVDQKPVNKLGRILDNSVVQIQRNKGRRGCRKVGASGGNNEAQLGSCSSEKSWSGTGPGSKLYLWPLAISRCAGYIQEKGKNTVLLPQGRRHQLVSREGPCT